MSDTHAPATAKGKTRWALSLFAAATALGCCAVIRSLRDHDRAPYTAGKHTAPCPPVVRVLSEQIAQDMASEGQSVAVDRRIFASLGDVTEWIELVGDGPLRRRALAEGIR